MTELEWRQVGVNPHTLPEIQAMEFISSVICGLDEEEIRRVITWVISRYVPEMFDE